MNASILPGHPAAPLFGKDRQPAGYDAILEGGVL